MSCSAVSNSVSVPTWAEISRKRPRLAHIVTVGKKIVQVQAPSDTAAQKCKALSKLLFLIVNEFSCDTSSDIGAISIQGTGIEPKLLVEVKSKNARFVFTAQKLKVDHDFRFVSPAGTKKDSGNITFMSPKTVVAYLRALTRKEEGCE